MRPTVTMLVQRGLSISVAALAVLRGCSCSNEPSSNTEEAWVCSEEGARPPDQSVCPAGQLYTYGTCMPERCDANEYKNCCPGMLCLDDGNCIVPPARIDECSTDEGCDGGRRCLTRPNIADTKSCGFPKVNAAGECPDGGTPFNKRCVTAPPCNGACSAGKVCNIDTNLCEDRPPAETGTDDSCGQTCGTGQLLVFSDPDLMLFERCCAVTCECLTLPPLAPGAWGGYSDLAASESSLFASAFDATYGDLVVATYDRASMQLSRLDYVDGVPAGGPIVADPQGPRGGVAEGPPTVGQFTAIALSGGEPRVAYYDVDAQQLKLAAYDTASGAWTTSVIDDGRDLGGADSVDVGRYASLLIDDAGTAHVTYYAHRASFGGFEVTTPVYARAKNIAPRGYEEWDHVAIEPTRGCSGCGHGEACVLTSDAPQCLREITTCDPACAEADLCVRVGGVLGCHAPTAINCPTCGAAEVCVLDGTTPICAPAPATCTHGCACDERCVQNGSDFVCRAALPVTLAEPCGGFCASGSACVYTGPGAEQGMRCVTTRDGCTPACAEDELCVDDGAGGAACRFATPYDTLADVPAGVGLFTSVAIGPGRTPMVTYYDQLRGHLRGAIARFAQDGDVTQGFAADAVACTRNEDVGRHPTIAVNTDGIAIAYQRDGGQTLWVCRGIDPFTCGNNQLVDDGVRPGNGVHRVGAYASMVTDTEGRLYIAYADQTDNDLVLSYEREGTWHRATLDASGMLGGFAAAAMWADSLYASSQLREFEGSHDRSHLAVVGRSLAELP